MSKKVGLWIDHKKAVLVFLEGTKETIKEIESKVEKHRTPEGSDPKPPKRAEDMKPEDQKDRKVKNHLNKYYEEVIACIHDAESILIFGPSEAKNEIKKQIKNQEMKKHVEDVQTSDKMTNPQIAAKVREHFANKEVAEKETPKKKKKC